MTIRDVLRKTRRILRIAVSSVVTRIHSFKNTHFISRKSSQLTYVANLLVVKKPIYARIAKICAESFYHHNPKCKIVMHVDSQTESAVRSRLRNLIKLGVLEVRNVNVESLSWQELKLELVLSMEDENEFFMDADLRWNGSIPHLGLVTYFVNEFYFDSKSPYIEMIESPSWKFGQAISMKNTSFISWGSYKISETDRLLVQEVMDYIDQVCTKENRFPQHQSSLIRISEQIALSVLADNISDQVTYLKSEDGFRDGAFVESSYFGATGSAF